MTERGEPEAESPLKGCMVACLVVLVLIFSSTSVGENLFDLARYAYRHREPTRSEEVEATRELVEHSYDPQGIRSFCPPLWGALTESLFENEEVGRLAVAYARRDTSILLTVSWDWRVDKWSLFAGRERGEVEVTLLWQEREVDASNPYVSHLTPSWTTRALLSNRNGSWRSTRLVGPLPYGMLR